MRFFLDISDKGVYNLPMINTNRKKENAIY